MSTHSRRKLAASYSSSGSHRFWQRVKRLPEPARSELYACGVLLQNLEGSVLLWLANAEESARPATRGRQRRKRQRISD
jgi:hypothetical protein